MLMINIQMKITLLKNKKEENYSKIDKKYYYNKYNYKIPFYNL